jgi:hypothetical protein
METQIQILVHRKNYNNLFSVNNKLTYRSILVKIKTCTVPVTQIVNKFENINLVEK